MLTLAAAVRMNTDICRQHGSKRFHVAAARSGEESLGKLKAALFVDLEARSCLADMGARPGSELAAGSGIAPDGGGDFLEPQPEHIVQQEGRPLERTQLGTDPCRPEVVASRYSSTAATARA